MSGKTCQLCGKPLGKMWAGDGEFCSREHRNQYRMRRGMDRLLEANQVASVLRRRETPKPVSSLHPPADSASRPADAPMARFSADLSSLLLPASRWIPAIRVPLSRGPIVWRPKLAAAQPRDFGILRAVAPRVVMAFRVPQIDPVGKHYLSRHREPCAIGVSARVGKALRVSAAAGFRLPRVQSQSLRVPLRRTAALSWPDRALAPDWRGCDFPAGSKRLAIDFERRPLWSPLVSVPPSAYALTFPGILRVNWRAGNGNGSAAARAWGSLWTHADQMLLPAMHNSRPGVDSAGFVRLSRMGLCGQDNPRLALVPLTPQDASFTYAPVIVPAVDRTPRAPGAKLQDHFESGLTNWVGGVEDWRVDVAGVRPGSLALFKPSIHMADYELEFLARIDHRSVTWVFRASRFNEYYSASIGVTPDGGFEFTRSATIGGVREPIVRSSLAIDGGKRTALTVRLRAVGNSFAVWVDGQKADTWTDGRLPSGGIGFMGAPDDRARIYWVRLSPAGEPCKEPSTVS